MNTPPFSGQDLPVIVNLFKSSAWLTDVNGYPLELSCGARKAVLVGGRSVAVGSVKGLDCPVVYTRHFPCRSLKCEGLRGGRIVIITLCRLHILYLHQAFSHSPRNLKTNEICVLCECDECQDR